jgi:uncharacterized membrane protein HdeD (DUF308 family)
MDNMIERIHGNTTWAIVLAILLIIVGILAMSTPVVAGVSVALMVGWLLVFGGVLQIVFALTARAGFLAVIIGILTVAAGGYMVYNPAVAIASLVMFLALYLLISGITEVFVAFAARPARGWGWLLFNAVISIALGGLMFTQFPVTGALAIGILLGFKLLFTGFMTLMIAMTVRKALK